MPKKRVDAAERAAADIHRANRLLESARRRLAHCTSCGSPPVIVHPSMRGIHRMLAERGPQLEKIPGVVGYGIGQVVKAGMPSGELCITVFVEKKLTKSQMARQKVRALPRTMSAGKQRVRVDVIPIGTLSREVFVGASIGTASPATATAGTVGAFAIDNGTGANVAITAMHVSGLQTFPNGQDPVRFRVPSRLKSGTTQPFGELAFGTQTNIDAAKITLTNPDDATNVVPGIGAIAGWRPVTIPGDNNASVRMFGAMTAQVVSGRIVHPSVALPAFGLQNAILADIDSQEGDSGSALIDSSNHILGFLVGSATGLMENFDRLRVFSPAADVMRVLGCDIP